MALAQHRLLNWHFLYCFVLDKDLSLFSLFYFGSTAGPQGNFSDSERKVIWLSYVSVVFVILLGKDN